MQEELSIYIGIMLLTEVSRHSEYDEAFFVVWLFEFLIISMEYHYLIVFLAENTSKWIAERFP